MYSVCLHICLTLALQADLSDSNVVVQEVVLPEVDSEYWEHHPGSRSRVPWLGRVFGTPVVPSGKAAVFVARAIETRRSVSSFGGTLPALLALNRWMPATLAHLVCACVCVCVCVCAMTRA